MKKHIDTSLSKTSPKNKEYTAINICRDHAVIEFEGILLAKTVLWRAEIRTLTYHCIMNKITTGNTQKFIDIPPNEIDHEQNIAKIILGLNLAYIDHSTIMSSSILIRQYKNLKPGQHKYGEIIEIQ